MSDKILVFYGSYRSDRKGIRLADWLVAQLHARGDDAELIDAKAVGLPILDRMYKEYPKGEAPEALETLCAKIEAADAFVFVTGEYNWGVQPGLKNLTDHFLEEVFWRPAAIAVGLLLGRLGVARLQLRLAQHPERDGNGGGLLDPDGGRHPGDAGRAAPNRSARAGEALKHAFPRFADELRWWTEATLAQKAVRPPPY